MATYMKIDSIEGNVTAKGYQNWIELKSFSFDIQRKLNTQPGRVANREGSKPSVGEIVLKKHLDKSSSKLFSEATVGKALPKVLIHFVTTGASPLPYLEYTLDNVIVTRHTVEHERVHADEAGAAEVYPTEIIALNFDKIEMKFTPFDKNHNAQSPIPAGYDLNEAVAC